MYCPACGAQSADDQHFCGKCGASLQGEPSPASPPIAGAAPSLPQDIPYAGFWKRAAAWLIDDALLSFVLGAAFGATAAASLSDGAVAALVIAYLLAPYLYFALMESSAAQATVGKLALGLKVTDLHGERISFAHASGRYFAHILSTLSLMIGYAMVVFTRRRQALHDLVAGTLVVRERLTPQEIQAAGPAPHVSPVIALLAVLGVVAFVVFDIGLLAALFIPAYQDYTTRSQVVEGLNAAGPYRDAVAAALSQGQLPDAIDSTNLNAPETGHGRYVDSVRVESGVIAIRYGAAANQPIAGKTLLLIPAVKSDGRTLYWICGRAVPSDGSRQLITEDLRGYTTIADKYLPRLCRGGT
jgi:uncharacterized RDD family membrane protein YckC/Tfp pilus assembly major pilin PilA